MQLVTERDGKAIGIGRVSRTISHWLKRLLKRRDNGCRFPNCTNIKGVEGHHIHWWHLGGHTDIDNLISLCRRHHRLIHHHGWQIQGNPEDYVDFVHPDGRVFSARLPAMQPKVKTLAQKLFAELM